MERFHKVTGGLQIIGKKLGNFADGFVCRRCQEWISWRPDKDALMARKRGLRKVPYNKLMGILEKLKKPLYCPDCLSKIQRPKRRIICIRQDG